MGNNQYLDNLMAELASQGVEPPKTEQAMVRSHVNDRELQIIMDMERLTGKAYSDEQRKILEHHGNAAILACAGSGKALVNGTGVLTPNGYVPIETLKIGDKVFDQDGTEQIVLGVYPQGKKKVHEVRFAAGEVIKCCKDHLWTIKNTSGYWETVNTLDIANMLITQRGVQVPSVNGNADDFLYGYCSDSYLEVLKNMLPSTERFKELLEIENNSKINKILQVLIEGNTVELLHTLYTFGSFPILFIKHEEMKNAIVTAFEFFGSSVKVIELTESEKDKHSANYALKFDDHFFDYNYKYIVGVKETDDYAEMTCIKVSGLSELFLTEHCIVTHNTTISTHLIAKRILTGEIKDVNKLIYTTYSKAGATEMKERLDVLLRQLDVNLNVQVRTLHSFFLQVLRTFGVTANIIDGSERSKMIRQACKDAEFPLKDDDLMLIDNLLSYQVNCLLSDKKTIDSYVNTLEDLTLEQYSKIRKSYASQKGAKGVIDYDDMQSYLYLWLVKYAKSKNQAERDIAKSVRDYCKAMYTDFYIDEAQDTSKIQFAIVRAMVADPIDLNKLDRGLVFIGDDDQAIYTWRGGDPSIILSVGPTFNMNTFVLSTNYRCLNEIVDYATVGIKCNNSRYNKGMNAFNQGGSVKILPSAKEDLCTLSILAMNHIKWWLKQGHNLSDIAVLSRNNFHLALLSNMLLREGIYCNMTEDMKLTKSYMYQDVKDIISISEPTWKKDLTAKVLWRLCRFMGSANARIIAEFQDSCGLSLEDALGWLIKHFVDSSIEFSKKVNVNMQAEQKMQYYMNRLANDTLNDILTVYKAISCEDREESVRTLLFQYLSASSFMYKSKDKNRSIVGLVQYIINLMKKDGFDKMMDFLRVTEQLEGGKMVIPGEKMTLSTIHSAKGREWRDVIMFACDNVSQPSFDGISGMIDDGISVHDIFENIDEERRLFYVGNTRAKENLLVITYGAPSIFILEALGLFKDKKGGNNDTVLELVDSQDIADRYKDFIQSNIMDSNSKYYYNSEDYAV